MHPKLIIISTSHRGARAQVVIHERDAAQVLRSRTRHVALRSGVAEVIQLSDDGTEKVVEAFDLPVS